MNVEINVRRNDRVRVITGKDKGKAGRVIEVLPRRRKVLVEGINMIKRHMKANSRQGRQGGILQREAPIDISNVMLICPHCSKVTRVSHQILGDGLRVRDCKQCGATIESQ
ncbi:MAG TPA: 50S ribosomal protein L24 [Blastocatellia bacterium]|nr:50S ribosomal protein L24 [Blastocatellia bacterium]